jgi:hypothetical protein
VKSIAQSNIQLARVNVGADDGSRKPPATAEYKPAALIGMQIAARPSNIFRRLESEVASCSLILIVPAPSCSREPFLRRASRADETTSVRDAQPNPDKAEDTICRMVGFANPAAVACPGALKTPMKIATATSKSCIPWQSKLELPALLDSSAPIQICSL